MKVVKLYNNLECILKIVILWEDNSNIKIFYLLTSLSFKDPNLNDQSNETN